MSSVNTRNATSGGTATSTDTRARSPVTGGARRGPGRTRADRSRRTRLRRSRRAARRGDRDAGRTRAGVRRRRRSAPRRGPPRAGPTGAGSPPGAWRPAHERAPRGAAHPARAARPARDAWGRRAPTTWRPCRSRLGDRVAQHAQEEPVVAFGVDRLVGAVGAVLFAVVVRGRLAHDVGAGRAGAHAMGVDVVDVDTQGLGVRAA